MRKTIGYALLTISVLTFIIWAVSQFIQPILPPAINNAGILLFAVLLTVTGVVANFKDVVELIDRILKPAPIQDSVKSLLNSGLEVQHNLPQPGYGEFIGRERELQEVMYLLCSRHFIITIDGIGGIGKSSLALEVANQLLHNKANLPCTEYFDVIIWFSAKRSVLTTEGIVTQNQTSLLLEDLLLTISTVLQPEKDLEDLLEQKKLQLVKGMLASKRALLIVDNLETIDDEAVLLFLREIPSPTKALVTTRHSIDVAYPIHLHGMSWADAKELIAQECHKKNVSLEDKHVKQLYERTGGVPLAIVWSVGLLGFGHTVDSVLKRLGDAQGDITQFCFEESVGSIRGTDSHKLLVLISMVDSPIRREALGQIADLSILDRDDALAKLGKLSLIEKRGDLFDLLPLTKNYARSELKDHPQIERDLRFELLYKYADLSFERIVPNRELWWKSQSVEQLSAPIGLVSLQQIQYLKLGGTLTHVLIAGMTGSGKTELIFTVVTSLTLLYSPIELQIYLPNNREYSRLLELPHIKRYDNSEPVQLLVAIKQELEKREELFKKSGVSSYSDYRRHYSEFLPRLLLVVEEIHYYSSDEAFLTMLINLVRRGRALGFHVLISTQDAHIDRQLMGQVSIRIIMRTRSPKQIKDLLSIDKDIADLSRFHPGQAIFSDGIDKEASQFQVAHLTPQVREQCLEEIFELERKEDLDKII